jgi:hypothetical protein
MKAGHKRWHHPSAGWTASLSVAKWWSWLEEQQTARDITMNQDQASCAASIKIYDAKPFQ